MDKTIEFNLSIKSIENAQKELRNFLDALKARVNKEFVQLSLEWIKKRAISYLIDSGLNSKIINEIRNSFITTIKNNSGTLELRHDKGAYIEFGVGIVGQGTNYPNKFSDINWEYNVPSRYKREDNHWSFKLKSNEPLDMLESSVTGKKDRIGRIHYSTTGQKGIMFMYNAIMDFANNGGIIESLYDQAMRNCLGE